MVSYPSAVPSRPYKHLYCSLLCLIRCHRGLESQRVHPCVHDPLFSGCEWTINRQGTGSAVPLMNLRAGSRRRWMWRCPKGRWWTEHSLKYLLLHTDRISPWSPPARCEPSLGISCLLTDLSLRWWCCSCRIGTSSIVRSCSMGFPWGWYRPWHLI